MNHEGIPDRVNPDLPPVFARDGREVDYFVTIICSDRGQHQRVRLTNARRELDGSRGMSHALRYFAPPMDDAEPRSLISTSSYVFRCPRCCRTPQVTADRWWKLVDAAASAGLDEIDISVLG